MIFTEDSNNYYGKARKFNLIGQTKACRVAMSDMAKCGETKRHEITDCLRYSVKEQLKLFNCIEVIELSTIENTDKRVPEPPKVNRHLANHY